MGSVVPLEVRSSEGTMVAMSAIEMAPSLELVGSFCVMVLSHGNGEGYK